MIYIYVIENELLKLLKEFIKNIENIKVNQKIIEKKEEIIVIARKKMHNF